MTLSPNTVLAQGTDHVETVVGEQIMMMNIHAGKYYALDGTARRIWEMLKQPATLESVVASLVSEYKVGKEQCEADVTDFVSDLIENGLVVEQSGESKA